MNKETARGARYRAAQLRRSLGACPTTTDLALAENVLTEPQQALFRSMSPRDRWHAIQTWRLMDGESRRDPDLALAALLHDAGKGYIRLHERVLFVVLARFPALLRRLAAPGEHGLRGALHRMWVHAEVSADRAAAAGTSQRAVELIRRHHDASLSGDHALQELIRADERA